MTDPPIDKPWKYPLPHIFLYRLLFSSTSTVDILLVPAWTKTVVLEFFIDVSIKNLDISQSIRTLLRVLITRQLAFITTIISKQINHIDTLSVHNKNKFGNHALEILFLGNINHFNVFVCKLILFICVVYLTHIL